MSIRDFGVRGAVGDVCRGSTCICGAVSLWARRLAKVDVLSVKYPKFGRKSLEWSIAGTICFA